MRKQQQQHYESLRPKLAQSLSNNRKIEQKRIETQVISEEVEDDYLFIMETVMND